MNGPIKDAFDCFSRKPMTRHLVSGFPRALLSLSQEKSSGEENARYINTLERIEFTTPKDKVVHLFIMESGIKSAYVNLPALSMI